MANDRASQIRATAIALFDERGYHGTSMKDIANAMNIRAPSLYNYLDSKQELFQSIVMEAMDTLMRTVDEAVVSTEDVVEMFRRATEAHVVHHTRFRRQSRIANREIASLDSPAREEMLDKRRRYTDGWRVMVDRGIAEGHFHTPSPKLAVFSILDMGIGVSTWYHGDGEMSPTAIAYRYSDIALRIVGWRGTDGATLPGGENPRSDEVAAAPELPR